VAIDQLLKMYPVVYLRLYPEDPPPDAYAFRECSCCFHSGDMCEAEAYNVTNSLFAQ